MSEIVTISIHEAEASVTGLERDVNAAAASRADLNARLAALRVERTEATRSMLLSGAPRKVWQEALRAEQEAAAMLHDVAALAVILDHDLVQARYGVQRAHQEAHRVAFAQRLNRVVLENGFPVPEVGSFVGDSYRAYLWLATVYRSDEVDRTRYASSWIDQMGGNVPTAAFAAAAMAHGDFKIEIGDNVIWFAVNRHMGRPAASLPLNGDPTPAINRSFVTTVKPNYQARR